MFAVVLRAAICARSLSLAPAFQATCNPTIAGESDGDRSGVPSTPSTTKQAPLAVSTETRIHQLTQRGPDPCGPGPPCSVGTWTISRSSDHDGRSLLLHKEVRKFLTSSHILLWECLLQSATERTT
jgi:hypothetical protein